MNQSRLRTTERSSTSADQSPLQIVIVDDLPALREHAAKVVHAVVERPHQIIEALNGEDVVKLAHNAEFALIIMDISMPELNGIKAAQQIWHDHPRQKILFWSQYHREAYIRELGKIVPDEAIHGYVLKSEADEKLGEAIHAVLIDDVPYIDPVVHSVQTRIACKDGALSDSEYETLLDITLGMTDRAMAARRHISVRGAQNRLSILLQKLVKGEDLVLREKAGMEVFNARTRIVFECLKRGLIDIDEFAQLDNDLFKWLYEEYDLQRAEK